MCSTCWVVCEWVDRNWLNIAYGTVAGISGEIPNVLSPFDLS